MLVFRLSVHAWLPRLATHVCLYHSCRFPKCHKTHWTEGGLVNIWPNQLDIIGVEISTLAFFPPFLLCLMTVYKSFLLRDLIMVIYIVFVAEPRLGTACLDFERTGADCLVGRNDGYGARNPR